MTMASGYEIGLAVLIVAVAVWTIAARETFAACVGFVVYGLLLAIAWVCLGAVDLAITEAAIGSGLTGVLLLGAAARMRSAEARTAAERPGAALCALAAALAATVAASLAALVLRVSGPASTLAASAAENLAATGLGNPVTAVLLAFRATDTLLEKVVLVLAIAGVWSLAPDRLWGGRPGPHHQADPHGPLVILARLLPPIGVIVGVYVLWVGADHPGGAFQGATIIAAMWLLAMMAGLTDAPPVSDRRLRLLLIAGPGVFIAVGLAGLWLGEAFLAYPVGHAKPIIVFIELWMTLSVALTLGLLLAGPPERKNTP